MVLKYLLPVILLLRNETPGHKNSFCLQLEGKEFKRKRKEKAEGKLSVSKSKFRQMSEGLKDGDSPVPAPLSSQTLHGARRELVTLWEVLILDVAAD